MLRLEKPVRTGSSGMLNEITDLKRLYLYTNGPLAGHEGHGPRGPVVKGHFPQVARCQGPWPTSGPLSRAMAPKRPMVKGHGPQVARGRV